MTTSVLDHHRLPVPIAEMGAWQFWAAPESVGLAAEDAAALRAGTATDEQRQRALEHGLAARKALSEAPVDAPFGRPC